MSGESDRHVVAWDVRVVRDYHPVYALGGKRYDQDPFGNVDVQIGVTFDNNAAALDFERKVRELLEEA